MKLTAGHLSYCTNIHAGENWADHFNALKLSFPQIKAQLSPDAPMGIGLRLSNIASIELLQGDNLAQFKQWLQLNDAYVFTMNGFPYGGFHNVIVKDQVHAPDWTTADRLAYTIRLFNILALLLPQGMDGGISTSPLSYKHWFNSEAAMDEAKQEATKNILQVAAELNSIKQKTGIKLHLDIEPEPDGVLETGREFIEWFETDLLPQGISYFQDNFNIPAAEAEILIKEHVNLCYDVCHFAIGYEPHEAIIDEVAQKGIKVGKIQISAALKASFDHTSGNKQAILTEFEKFNEPTYLHQVIARLADGNLLRYADLPEALMATDDAEEWRAHFHVPVFLEDFGLLQSTQADIVKVLGIQKNSPFTNHLEVETYTWGVLPDAMRIPLTQSIIRELEWVKYELTN
ncbi:metabolite traffic protein EboE [Mucilaginibacter sp.]|uniref:metabolite traffic protein EboE n=1 Tax=Mucilaginibacter sp. TaxID=1882438 RepID=UPI0025CBC62B|nr:metabolite traffic protein EboE [Mucilaginibacter sp.]